MTSEPLPAVGAGSRKCADVSSGADSLHEEVRVPGSGAPSLSVPSLLNSLPRLLLKCDGSLSTFLQSMIHSIVPLPPDEATPQSGAIWPMPFPYPETFGASACSKSKTSWRKSRTNLHVTCLNWLWSGGRCNFSKGFGNSRLSTRQWRTVRLLEAQSEDENSVSFLGPSDLGRVAAKSENFDLEIAALHRTIQDFESTGNVYSKHKISKKCGVKAEPQDAHHFGNLVGATKVKDHVAAKQIEAHRLTFSGRPGFNPLPYLDNATSAAYNDPLARARHISEVDEKIPKVAVHADRKNRQELFRRLAETGRLQPVPKSLFRKGLGAGMFSVVKDLQKDRLILDARPANLMEPQMNKWTKSLASPSCFSTLELPANMVLHCSGQDLRDYFYQFVVTDVRTARNSLCCWLDLQDCEVVFPDKDFTSEGGTYVGLSTMAMGDLLACEVAQASHLGLILSCGGAYPDELLQYRSPVPDGLLSVGVVIDDLVVLEMRLRSELDKPSQADARMEKILEAYRSVGLEANPKKEFRNTPFAKFWGVEVDGIKGLVRPASSRLWPIVMITIRICRLGLCTAGLMEAIAGTWVSVFCLRRRLMSLMELIFKLIASASSPSDVYRLSPALIDELWSMALLGQLACINLRAETAAKVFATDASTWGMAAVEAEVPVDIVREVCRNSLTKSTWSRLLPPLQAWKRAKGLLDASDELPEGDVFDVRPLWELMARALTYKECWRKEVRNNPHINILELRAFLRHEARIAASSYSCRLLAGLDSQVALGALCKGRSASHLLNRELRRSLPSVLGSDLSSFHMYFPSATNRSDAPTRAASVPGPDLPLPDWWEDAANGKLEKMKKWIEDAERKVGTEKLDFSLLSQNVCDADDRTNSKIKREALRLSRKHRLPVSAAKSIATKSPPKDDPVKVLLTPEAIEILESFDPSQILWGKGPKEFLEPGALDLYSGHKGVARSLCRNGCPWVVTFDWEHSVSEDLLNSELQKKILRLVELGAVKVVGSAIICSSFSRAVTPCVRSRRYPRGVPWMKITMKTKVAQGNAHADFNALLIRTAEAHGVLFWLENPDSSHLWAQKGFEKYKDPHSPFICRAGFCRFKTMWRKRTRIATNVPHLVNIRKFCDKSHSHQPLRGFCHRYHRPWTKVAEPYPRGFAEMIGVGCSLAAGWRKQFVGKFNVGSCAHTGTLRVGEAANPGPRGRRMPRPEDLESRPVLGLASIALGERNWNAFMMWAADASPGLDLWKIFTTVPVFLAHAIRRYGNLQYQAGGSLSNLRHLVLAAQRKIPTFRPFAHISWEMVQRWEKMEPVCHRVPVPEPLVISLVVMAWNFGWRRWACCTLVTFYGIGRIGEVLAARRGHLILPKDILETKKNVAYLRLDSSKTSYRSGSKVQHLKVTDDIVVKLLEKTYYNVPPEVFLYDGTPGVYRRRWDWLLQRLSVSKELRLSPGGLRGGGAVTAYRRGQPLMEIMWSMRLQQISTLQSYLQEVAAATALTAVSKPSRKLMRSLNKLYPMLVFSDS